MQLSCGEHTDYGLLTLVNQEPGVSALQVRSWAHSHSCCPTRLEYMGTVNPETLSPAASTPTTACSRWSTRSPACPPCKCGPGHAHTPAALGGCPAGAHRSWPVHVGQSE